MAERSRQLVIFLRAPQAGRVKTRLGREIGMTAAAWWYRHRIRRLVRSLGRDPRWRTVLSVTPDTAAGWPVWPTDATVLPQGGGDLGARMSRVFRSLPPGPVLLIGGDVPGIRPAHVAEAFGMLGRFDAVFGPALDGGFWLAGLSRRRGTVPAHLFEGVRWSTHHALADSLATVPAEWRIGFAAALRDVDTAEDLAATSSDPHG